MYAIVDLNGKQYKLEEGRYTDIDNLDLEPGQTLTVETVQFVASEGKDAIIGAPYIKGATVTIKVLEHRKDRKVVVFKMKRKKGYRRKQGHRARLTRVQVETIKTA